MSKKDDRPENRAAEQMARRKIQRAMQSEQAASAGLSEIFEEWRQNNRELKAGMLEAIGKIVSINNASGQMELVFNDKTFNQLHEAYGNAIANSHLPYSKNPKDTFGWMQTVGTNLGLLCNKKFIWKPLTGRNFVFKTVAYIAACHEFNVKIPETIQAAIGNLATSESQPTRIM